MKISVQEVDNNLYVVESEQNVGTTNKKYYPVWQ